MSSACRWVVADVCFVTLVGADVVAAADNDHCSSQQQHCRLIVVVWRISWRVRARDLREIKLQTHAIRKITVVCNVVSVVVVVVCSLHFSLCRVNDDDAVDLNLAGQSIVHNHFFGSARAPSRYNDIYNKFPTKCTSVIGQRTGLYRLKPVETAFNQFLAFADSCNHV